MKLQDYKNQGFSLLEITIGLAIAGFLALAGTQIMKSSNQMFSKSMTRINFQSERDTNFRKLREEIENSQPLQLKALQCDRSVVDRVSKKGSILIDSENDNFSLAFTDLKAIGVKAANPNPTQLFVSNANMFRKGTIIFLQSLDQDGVSGVYRVSQVSDNSILTLDEGLEINPIFSCKINSDNPKLSSMLSSAANRKFSVSRLSFANYKLTQGLLTKSIQLESGTADLVKLPPISGLKFLKIDYEFTPDSEEGDSGRFYATLTSEFDEVNMSGAKLNKKLTITASYNISQDKVNNMSAQVEALTSDQVYPSCMLSATSIKNSFALDSHKDEFRNFYKIDVALSEMDFFSTAGLKPEISLTPVSIGQAVKCWKESDVNPTMHYDRYLLKGAGTDSNLVFSPEEITKTKIIPRSGNELYEPIICEVPDAADFSGQMRYTIVSTSGVSTGVVDCSQTKVAQSKDEWFYSEKPSCSRDGTIDLGVIQSKDDQEVPKVYVKNDSCWWDGSYRKNCSMHQVLSNDPGATLQRVSIYPSNIRVKSKNGDIVDETIYCH